MAIDVEVRREGLFLPSLDLFLDPSEPVARAFISHAHGDHVAEGAHGEVFASPETIALMRARRHDVGVTHVLEWGEHRDVGDTRWSIAPAGHVLGAAQLVVDDAPSRGGSRFVYTGDYRPGVGRTHVAGAPVACDTLLMESTFGLPIFRFPPRAEVERAIVAWCRATIDEGSTPVLMGYALGKAQELVHLCLSANLPVVAHGAVHRMCAAYESLGVELGVKSGALRAYAEEKARTRGRDPTSLRGALIVPPWTQGQPMIRRRNDARVAYVSGWALLDATIDQKRADAAFPLSDHADHDALVALVEACKAQDVLVTHGDDADVFAEIVGGRALATPPIDARDTRARDA